MSNSLTKQNKNNFLSKGHISTKSILKYHSPLPACTRELESLCFRPQEGQTEKRKETFDFKRIAGLRFKKKRQVLWQSLI